MLKFDVQLSPNVKKKFAPFSFRNFGHGYGYFDVFKKPWAEAVREGSPHFPNGKLDVKATVKLVTKD